MCVCAHTLSGCVHLLLKLAVMCVCTYRERLHLLCACAHTLSGCVHLLLKLAVMCVCTYRERLDLLCACAHLLSFDCLLYVCVYIQCECDPTDTAMSVVTCTATNAWVSMYVVPVLNACFRCCCVGLCCELCIRTLVIMQHCSNISFKSISIRFW